MQTPLPRPEPPATPTQTDGLSQTVQNVNTALHQLWNEDSAATGDIPADDLSAVKPAAKADDLTILRRLSLALHGTVPSLEEVRRFQADQQPDRLLRWTSAMLEDTRFNDYFAERLAEPTWESSRASL